MSTASVGSGTGTPLNITGLASGLDSAAIIKALLNAERVPITQLTHRQEKLQGQANALASMQSSMRALSFAAFEFRLGALFENSQAVSSSEPLRVSAATTSGAGVGGYEVEVSQLANSAQRTFTFAPPAGEDTVTIDGSTYTLKAGGSAKELASIVNGDSKATVYAAVLDNETIVFSSRTTGASTPEFIKVSDSAGALVEKAGTAKEGRDAKFLVDGVAGSSASNTVTNAIAGVTLTLNGLTASGPVTITVQPPGPSVSTIEAQVQSFVTLYNTTVEAVQKQLSTRPPTNPQNAEELATGTLFGDSTLSSALNRLRQTMYEPLAGLPAEMASPFDIGISTGAPTTGSSPSQSALQGLLKLDPTKLANAIAANPNGVKEMLKGWSKNLEEVANNVANAGGPLASRITSDEGQISELKVRINSMNEILAVRQKSLVATYAKLEGIINKNSAQSSWLTQQTESLSKSGL
jgi:flagellar hook-associated protein 2